MSLLSCRIEAVAALLSGPGGLLTSNHKLAVTVHALYTRETVPAWPYGG